jgi:hypothetical protein
MTKKLLTQLTGVFIAVAFGALSTFSAIEAPDAKSALVKGSEIPPWGIPAAISAGGFIVWFLPIIWPYVLDAWSKWRGGSISGS